MKIFFKPSIRLIINKLINLQYKIFSFTQYFVLHSIIKVYIFASFKPIKHF